MTLVCKKCGGKNIGVKVWIDPNTDIVLDTCSDGEIEDNWCNDCEIHDEFIEENEYKI